MRRLVINVECGDGNEEFCGKCVFLSLSFSENFCELFRKKMSRCVDSDSGESVYPRLPGCFHAEINEDGSYHFPFGARDKEVVIDEHSFDEGWPS